jgi:hypothetical protein
MRSIHNYSIIYMNLEIISSPVTNFISISHLLG